MEDKESSAVLNLRLKQREPGHPSGDGAQSSHRYLPWIWVALGFTWAGIILVLLRAVMALAVWEGSGCKLCPRDWRPHGDKCYWLSKERKAWNRSRDDCSRRKSQMLVIQNQEELGFIQGVIRAKDYVWIGLNRTAPGRWTWVDGSPLDPTRFPVSAVTGGPSCARLTGSQIQPEPCGAELQWICQKEAAVI